MKKGWFAGTMALVVLAAPLAALTCQCVFGECGAAGVSVSPKTPSCHHAAQPVEDTKNPGQGCCGKCQIERAVITAQKLANATLQRFSKGLSVFYVKCDQAKPVAVLAAHPKDFSDPPYDFFTGHVLLTTFAFRGPPVG